MNKRLSESGVIKRERERERERREEIAKEVHTVHVCVREGYHHSQSIIFSRSSLFSLKVRESCRVPMCKPA